MNAIETKLLCVRAVKLKKKKRKEKKTRLSRFVPAPPGPFIFPHLSRTNG